MKRDHPLRCGPLFRSDILQERDPRGATCSTRQTARGAGPSFFASCPLRPIRSRSTRITHHVGGLSGSRHRHALNDCAAVWNRRTTNRTAAERQAQPWVQRMRMLIMKWKRLCRHVFLAVSKTQKHTSEALFAGQSHVYGIWLKTASRESRKSLSGKGLFED